MGAIKVLAVVIAIAVCIYVTTKFSAIDLVFINEGDVYENIVVGESAVTATEKIVKIISDTNPWNVECSGGKHDSMNTGFNIDLEANNWNDLLRTCLSMITIMYSEYIPTYLSIHFSENTVAKIERYRSFEIVI